jgi:hypothetical protein
MLGRCIPLAFGALLLCLALNKATKCGVSIPSC